MNELDPKLIIVLTVIMICSATVLTYLHQVTNPIIEGHAEREREEAIQTVLPEAEDYREVTEDGLTFYEGVDGTGSTVGYALENSGQGFQDELVLMVGLDLSQQEIIKIEVLNHAETPGLGARIDEADFKAQFQNKSFEDSFQTDQDVDSISGATYSAQAVADIVKDATQKVQQVSGGGE